MADRSAENLQRIRAWDAWEESDHPRANNGQFTSGGGGGGREASPENPKKSKKVELTSAEKAKMRENLYEDYGFGLEVDNISWKINQDNWDNGKRDIKDVVDYRVDYIGINSDDSGGVTYDVELKDMSVGHRGKPIKLKVKKKQGQYRIIEKHGEQ